MAVFMLVPVVVNAYVVTGEDQAQGSAPPAQDYSYAPQQYAAPAPVYVDPAPVVVYEERSYPKRVVDKWMFALRKGFHKEARANRTSHDFATAAYMHVSKKVHENTKAVEENTAETKALGSNFIIVAVVIGLLLLALILFNIGAPTKTATMVEDKMQPRINQFVVRVEKKVGDEAMITNQKIGEVKDQVDEVKGQIKTLSLDLSEFKDQVMKVIKPPAKSATSAKAKAAAPTPAGSAPVKTK